MVVILPTDGAVSEPHQSNAEIDLIGMLLLMLRPSASLNIIVTAAFGFKEVPIAIVPSVVFLIVNVPRVPSILISFRRLTVLAVMLFSEPSQTILPILIVVLLFMVS